MLGTKLAVEFSKSLVFVAPECDLILQLLDQIIFSRQLGTNMGVDATEFSFEGFDPLPDTWESMPLK